MVPCLACSPLTPLLLLPLVGAAALQSTPFLNAVTDGGRDETDVSLFLR
jgi:hypothetical protein